MQGSDLVREALEVVAGVFACLVYIPGQLRRKHQVAEAYAETHIGLSGLDELWRFRSGTGWMLDNVAIYILWSLQILRDVYPLVFIKQTSSRRQ